MMSSYTATCFWLYGNNVQDGLLLQWVDESGNLFRHNNSLKSDKYSCAFFRGISWERFKHLFMQHFRVSAEVTRGLQDHDFDLLQYKIQCNDCKSTPNNSMDVNNSVGSKSSIHPSTKTNKQANNAFVVEFLEIITFKNMLCPHLRYECGNTNVRFSVWRGMLELLQLFQDLKTNVRKLWEKNLIMGFLEFEQVNDMSLE